VLALDTRGTRAQAHTYKITGEMHDNDDDDDDDDADAV